MSDHTANWIAVLNACEITPDDMDLAGVTGFMTPAEWSTMLQSDPTPDVVVLLLAMRADAAMLATKLARLAARRDEFMRQLGGLGETRAPSVPGDDGR